MSKLDKMNKVSRALDLLTEIRIIAKDIDADKETIDNFTSSIYELLEEATLKG